jgi:Zn-dependent membrane protease YugP
MFFDPLYLIMVLLPGLALSLWASYTTKRNFTKYSKVPVATGLTGAEAAQRLLDGAGIRDVTIVPHRGLLSDHYNPMTKTLALSEAVYGQRSVAAVGVAAHEAGHAIQHARHYAPMWLRSLLVPTANIGSSLGYIVMVFGLILGSMGVFWVGVGLFAMVLLFQVVTLPVEFDASSRAKALVTEYGIVTQHERRGIDAVLNAAALTYVAAAVSTALTLLYFLMRAGVLGGRD